MNESSTDSILEPIKLDHQIECYLKHLPSASSVSIGLFLNVGGQNESDNLGGMSHFLEHMCFRGTKNRTAYQITSEVDALGGYINACTHKEYTQYYITTLPEHLSQGIDILTDVVFNSLHRQKDITLEQSIISEEIKMVEDTPDDKIHDLFANEMFPNHHLGTPILGTIDSIHQFNETTVKNYYQYYYNAHNIKIVIAGNIPSKQPIIDQLNAILNAFPIEQKPVPTEENNVDFSGKVNHHSKQLEQFHCCVGYPGLSQTDKSRASLSVLSNILGGSMSSRLFQEVREKKGLAYSIYSHASFYRQTGQLVIYAGTSPSTSQQTIDQINNELQSCCNSTITIDELNRSKQQLKGNLIIHLESSSAWVNWLGRQLIYNTGVSTLQQLKTSIDAVQINDVNSMANQIVDANAQILVSIGQS